MHNDFRFSIQNAKIAKQWRLKKALLIWEILFVCNVIFRIVSISIPVLFLDRFASRYFNNIWKMILFNFPE